MQQDATNVDVSYKRTNICLIFAASRSHRTLCLVQRVTSPILKLTQKQETMEFDLEQVLIFQIVKMNDSNWDNKISNSLRFYIQVKYESAFTVRL